MNFDVCTSSLGVPNYQTPLVRPIMVDNLKAIVCRVHRSSCG